MIDCLIYNYYSNMAPRTSIFGDVFFVSKSLLGIERQNKLKQFAILTQKPWSYVRVFIIYIQCRLLVIFSSGKNSQFITTKSIRQSFAAEVVR